MYFDNATSPAKYCELITKLSSLLNPFSRASSRAILTPISSVNLTHFRSLLSSDVVELVQRLQCRHPIVQRQPAVGRDDLNSVTSFVYSWTLWTVAESETGCIAATAVIVHRLSDRT